ncbi:MAG: FAD binding domain-containing protein [Bdellovibrionales bacterium]|nr:FAD binding domain-containing protein [Bdellovibrionales bacterium]
MKTRDWVTFTLNGVVKEVRGEWIFKTLSDYLRYERRLTGTKVVCAEGDCGACTVLRSPVGLGSAKPRFEAINSCIALVGQMDGSALVTIEGLGTLDRMNPVQESMMKSHGSQCGYCTPGFVVAMTWMLEKGKLVDERAVKNHTTGNLCRCTGYQPIVEAGLQAGKLRDQDPKAFESQTTLKRYLPGTQKKELEKAVKKPVQIVLKEDPLGLGLRYFYAPTTLKELAWVRKKYPNSTILGASTDLGVVFNKGKRDLRHLVSLHLIQELYAVKKTPKGLAVGARVTLSDLRRAFEKEGANALAQSLDLFASPQIKNSATLSGNIANASPIGDTPPVLLAMGADVLVLRSKTGKQEWIPLDRFFLGYRKTALKPGDVLLKTRIPLPKKGEYFQFFKNSQRKDLDISCVSCAVWSKADRSAVRIAFGGVAATPYRAKAIEKELALKKGQKTWSLPQLQSAMKTLQDQIQPVTDLRGSTAYRRILAEGILRKILNEIPTS